MTAKFIVLLVEDIESDIERFIDSLREFNEANAGTIEFESRVTRTKEEAFQILADATIHCAIVDIRVPRKAGSRADERDGNAVIAEIFDAHPMPIVVCSGHGGELSIENREKLPVAIITKEAESYTNAFMKLAALKPLMEALGKLNKDVRRHASRVFVTSLWPRWQEHGAAGDPMGLYQGIFVRQLVSYVAEELSLPGAESQDHHILEFYFQPPVRTEMLHTGDIVEHDGETYVVVTPRCDLVREYPEYLLLAKCESLRGEWKKLKEKIARNNGQVSNSVNKDLKKYATQGWMISQHFLPPCGNRGPWAVDFKSIISVPKKVVIGLLKSRFASIAPQFIPNLTQRCAAYLGRMGQPELSIKSLIDSVNKIED